MLLRKRRQEAFFLAASALARSGLVYVLKIGWVGAPGAVAVGVVLRVELPELSHARRRCNGRGRRAGVLAVMRLRPTSGTWAIGVALAWKVLVALSRLVLGVHWPTDVLAAACLGAAIPLVLSLALAFSHDGSNRSSH